MLNFTVFILSWAVLLINLQGSYMGVTDLREKWKVGCQPYTRICSELLHKLTGISFISVPVTVTGIQFLTNPPCLLDGTSVIIQCVTFGFPRPQITFNKGTMPITLGIGTFNNFGQLDYDTLNFTVIGRDDQGVYSCTAWNRDMELSYSPHKTLLFCSKC